MTGKSDWFHLQKPESFEVLNSKLIYRIVVYRIYIYVYVYNVCAYVCVYVSGVHAIQSQ